MHQILLMSQKRKRHNALLLKFCRFVYFQAKFIILIALWASKFTQSLFELLSLPYCKWQADNMVEVSYFL